MKHIKAIVIMFFATLCPLCACVAAPLTVEQGDALRTAAEGYDADAMASLASKAKDGDPVAQYELGLVFRRFLDIDKAEYWMLQAANQGNIVAARNLGRLHVDRCESRRSCDVEQAEYWYRKAANQGDAPAQSDLGRLLLFGPHKDAAQAIEWFLKAANQGDPTAQALLGHVYDTGQGVVEDKEQAAYWYRKAADLGNLKAQSALGRLYESGQGVEQDNIQAVKWYRLAAERGSASAQFDMGRAFENGLGTSQDSWEAQKWYRLAADQGYTEAQLALGQLYEAGKGVNDVSQAHDWYGIAANRGSKVGQYRLGHLYETGVGVPQDYEKAVYWYRQAAGQGDAEAIFHLASFYEKGFGVPATRVVAYALNLFVLTLPDSPSMKDVVVPVCDRLSSSLSALEQEEAEKLFKRIGEGGKLLAEVDEYVRRMKNAYEMERLSQVLAREGGVPLVECDRIVGDDGALISQCETVQYSDANGKSRFGGRVQAVWDGDALAPIVKHQYRITFSDGRVLEGVTDENGLTEAIHSSRPEAFRFDLGDYVN